MPQIGIVLIIGIDVVADLGKGLIDVLDIVVGFHREHRIGIDLPLVDAADNGAPIQPALRAALIRRHCSIAADADGLCHRPADRSH